MNIRVRKCGGPLGLCTEQCVGGSASASWKECCCNQVDSEGDAEHCSVAGADVSFHSFVVSLRFFVCFCYFLGVGLCFCLNRVTFVCGLLLCAFRFVGTIRNSKWIQGCVTFFLFFF